uniref:Nucleic acid binding protein n=1 Tax=Rhizophora mucronata TaxID=61149 RepID=A0A2P2J520_RHIMU
MGTPEQIAKAEQLINEVLAEADAGGSGNVSRRFTGQGGSEHFVMRIPNNKVSVLLFFCWVYFDFPLVCFAICT